MKLEQIPGDYDNVDQRALELLKTNDYELAEYIKELYANIQILNKVAPWDMEYDGRWQTRDYLARAKANQ